MAGEYQIHLTSGLTVYALVFDANRTKIWNGSAFVAISSVADADWADGKVACTEQTTSDTTGTGLYVGNRPSGISGSATYLVEFYSGVPTPGDDNWGIQLDEFGVTTIAASVTATALKVEIADYLGYGRNTEGAGSAWSADQIAKLNACLLSGARQFYWPPPIDRNGLGHRWSFLKPVTTLALVADTADYTLPSGFGGLVGKMYYAADDNVWHEIKLVGYGRILKERSLDPSTSAPSIAALVCEDADGTAAQNWYLAVGPGAPDDAYTLSYQYQITPQSLGGAYNLGGSRHYETLLASCLAIAEQRYQDLDQSGSKQRYWLERLAASVAMDRTNAPATMGYCGDPGTGGRSARERLNGFVTVQDVLYTPD